MEKHPIGDIMETTMKNIREMVDVNTIIGDPIVTADGITLIPVSTVSFGFTSGGTDFHGKKQPPEASSNFGGGVGAGVRITPVAFVVVKGDSVRMMSIAPPPTTTIERVIETVPDVIDKVTDFVNNRKTETTDK